MNLTSPDNIAYASTSDDLSVEDITAAMATSVQDALDDLVNDTRQRQTYRWADTTARTGQTGMQAGDEGYQIDTATDYIYTGSAWVVNTGGLIRLNRQTITAGSPGNVDGIFTSAFRNYRIVVDGITSGNANILMVLRVGGVASVTNYDFTQVSGTGAATAVGSQTLNAAAWTLSGSGINHSVGFDLNGPQVAAATLGTMTFLTTPNPMVNTTSTLAGTRGVLHRSSTQYDGAGFSLSGGTFTGTITIYGYA